VVEFWRGWFARNADARFEAEEVIVSGNRATVRWYYRKMRNGQPWHLIGRSGPGFSLMEQRKKRESHSSHRNGRRKIINFWTDSRIPLVFDL